mmetsp:Transcript_14866/g.34291  ORF Transcript_14866/g.34291 Transcript_14866/m.34291 type:complete len:130 (+) Transcript_14866:288-677(+)
MCLVVDDVASIRKLLSNRLQRLHPDMDVRTAVNGEEGLGMMKCESFDIVITDVVMPVMSGPQMVAGLRRWEAESTARRTPVVGMSANTSVQDVQAFLEQGMDGYMDKPVPSSAQELCTLLLTAIEKGDT